MKLHTYSAAIFLLAACAIERFGRLRVGYQLIQSMRSASGLRDINQIARTSKRNGLIDEELDPFLKNVLHSLKL